MSIALPRNSHNSPEYPTFMPTPKINTQNTPSDAPRFDLSPPIHQVVCWGRNDAKIVRKDSLGAALTYAKYLQGTHWMIFDELDHLTHTSEYSKMVRPPSELVYKPNPVSAYEIARLQLEIADLKHRLAKYELPLTHSDPQLRMISLVLK